jgi:hypothetical protein
MRRCDRDFERIVAASCHLIITLAARHKLPAVYYERFYVADGGLISDGADYVDQYRRTAAYVDRILKGEKPADLPVQAPTFAAARSDASGTNRNCCCPLPRSQLGGGFNRSPQHIG